MGKYEIYQDTAGEWRFRLKAENGKVIAVSEGYTRKESCYKGITSVQDNADSHIVEVEE